MRLPLLLCLTLLQPVCPSILKGQNVSARGTTSTRPQEAVALQRLLDQHEYIEYDDKLLATDSTHMTGPQNLYFSGMLAFHLGSLEDAGQRLSRVVKDAQDHSLTGTQIAEALETLGQVDLRLTSYAAAAEAEGMLSQRLGSGATPDRKAVADRRHLAELLADVPQQTIDLAGTFHLSAVGKPSATGPEYPVSIPGVATAATPFRARFDSGAEISLLSASTAKAWGVTMLAGTATLLGAGGSTFLAQPGFIPVLTIGKAQLHNVAVYVTKDDNLFFAPLKVQLGATLGFPVMRALGRLTFEQDGSLLVDATSPERDPRSTSLWLAAHVLLIELATHPVFKDNALVKVEADRLFVLDTGSASTVLTSRYLAEHTDAFKGQKPRTGVLGGLDGQRELSIYQAQNLPLFVNSSGVIVLSGQPILMEPTPGPGADYFGIIGQDALAKLPAYTVDFRSMTFSVGR